MRGKIGQRFVDRHRQREKFLEVFVVCRPLFRLLPQICNGMVIWSIRRQGLRRDPIALGHQKCLSRCARVRTGAIVDQKQVRGGLLHDPLQEHLVMF